MISSFWYLINIFIFIVQYVVFLFLCMFIFSLFISKVLIDRIINASIYKLFKSNDDDLIKKIYDLDSYELQVLYEGRGKISEFSIISLISVISLVVNQYVIYEFGTSKQDYINHMSSFILKCTYYVPTFFSEIQKYNFYYDCSKIVRITFTFELFVALIIITLLMSLHKSINKYNTFIDKLRLVILMSKDKSKNTKEKIKIRVRETILGK